ncbi:hypothetical protein BGZ68_000224 [Mortierella alpina]|nr:hypothetical protein BGZ68_000224 [Mortierella alpina]
MAFRMLVGYHNVLSVRCREHDSLRIQSRYDARANQPTVDDPIPETDSKSSTEFVFTGFASRDKVLADIEEQRMMHGKDTMAVSDPSPYEQACNTACGQCVVGGKHRTPNASAGFCAGYNQYGTSCMQLSPPSATSSTVDMVKEKAERRSLTDFEDVSLWGDIAPSNRSRSSVSLNSSESQEFFGATMDFNPQSVGSNQRLGCSSESSMVEVMISQAASAGQHNSQKYSDRISAPIPIQFSAASASTRGPKLKSPTPPPSLLSPSLTTTKVSRSSPMVRGAAGPGNPQEPPIRLRKGLRNDGIEEEERVAEDWTATSTSTSPCKGSTIQSSPQLDSPTSIPSQAQQRPMSNADVAETFAQPHGACGCAKHYKYPILSTIVPASLEKCFEILFSAKGAGQGDRLVSETLRSVNGSKSIKITPWTKNQAEDRDGSSAWEGKIRTLEHSSILKAHHANNARTDCRETQRVLEYNPHTIRVLSDVWPNLSGGHLISLLSQICLSWDSPGYSRIKCFTEVEYTRAPSWVSAYEADLLEPIDRFYKELIRRLVESIDKRDDPHPWPTTTTTISNSPSATIPVSEQSSLLAKASSTFQPSTHHTKTPQPQNPPDPSPALSLLSQQLRKHPPAQCKQSRASMESIRPTVEEPVVQPHASHALAVPIARRNKAAALIIQAMFPVSIAPTINQPVMLEQTLERNSSRAGDLIAKSDAAAAILWTGLLKKGTSMFKTVTNRKSAVPFAGQLVTSASENVNKVQTSKSSSALSLGSTKVSDKSKSEIEDAGTADLRLSPTVGSCCSRDQNSRSLEGQRSGKQITSPAPSYTILRVVFVSFAVGMVISAMNVWHLYSAVSSVVDVLQLSHGSISLSDAAHEHHSVGYQRDTFQKHRLYYHETLGPIQKQKELLRAEISELILMLDSVRSSSKQDHDTKSMSSELHSNYFNP